MLALPVERNTRQDVGHLDKLARDQSTFNVGDLSLLERPNSCIKFSISYASVSYRLWQNFGLGLKEDLTIEAFLIGHFKRPTPAGSFHVRCDRIGRFVTFWVTLVAHF